MKDAAFHLFFCLVQKLRCTFHLLLETPVVPPAGVSLFRATVW